MKVYNTLSREKEEFIPLDGKKVNVYICGLTVYDYMHIGHARTYLAFDSILRYLRYRGYDVHYVQNVTDVDDKIIKRANERGLAPDELTKDFNEKSIEDQRTLGLMEPEKRPKVTENIGNIIKAVKELIDKGFAYEANGSVYFDLSKADDYGKLSHRGDGELAKQRLDANSEKRGALDFAVWKKVPEDEYGFKSPWGHGRPGWHIECSVMSREFLGEQLDIHGGALDLIFPHHENEIAQSEALSGKPFVKYWMHTGFLQSSGEKMSKSLGNIIPVREFLKKFSKEGFRLFILQTHYRSPIDYSTKNVEEAEKAFLRLKEFRRRLSEGAGGQASKAKELSSRLKEDFIREMDDDFNSPNALSLVFDFVRAVNAIIDSGEESKDSLDCAAEVFDELLSSLGLEVEAGVSLSDEDKKLIEEREEYRKQKNWAKSDRIRDEFLKKGIKLIDNKDGSTSVAKA